MTTLTPPTLLDRIRGYEHHDCADCREVARLRRQHPGLRVNHRPTNPPPKPAPMPPHHPRPALRPSDEHPR
jgi:hypothetical protein